MHLSIAVAKVNKYAVRLGGDTLEMIERPHGGLSLVLADGQSSGPGAKAISIQVVRKVVAELTEGVRDGAAARAANDTLNALRGGKVSATLAILSVDLDARVVVVTRCGDVPVFIYTEAAGLRQLPGAAPALGFRRNVRPLVDTIPLELGLMACAFTDGVIHAGKRAGRPLDVATVVGALWAAAPCVAAPCVAATRAQALADGLLAQAMQADDNRPADDISIAVLHVLPGEGAGPRFMRVEMPVPDALTPGI